MRRRNVVLTERHENIIAHAVMAGKYPNVREAMRELFWLIENGDFGNSERPDLAPEKAPVGLADFKTGEAFEVSDDAVEDAIAKFEASGSGTK